MLLAGAATEPTTRPAESVPSLIADLSSPDFSVREIAEKRLSDQGPAIEPVLQNAMRGNISDEAKARLAHVLEQLDQSKILHASLTMHYTDAPLAKVVNDFAWQSGGDLGAADPTLAQYLKDRTASLDLNNADFWTAMKGLNAAGDLVPNIGPTGMTLAPDGLPISGEPVQILNPEVRSFGGLLLVPHPCQEIQNSSGNQPAGESTVIVTIDVIPEPKLYVVNAMNMDWFRECVDDKGQSLSSIGRAPRRLFFGARKRQWSWPLNITLREGARQATKISRLKGEVNFFVQTRGEILEIPNITRAKNVTKSDEDISLTVLSCSKTGQNFALSLRLRGAGMRDPAFRDFMTSAELLDVLGQPIARQSFGAVQAADGLTINTLFVPALNMPDKLRWDRTLEQKRLSIPFELDDLPLAAVR